MIKTCNTCKESKDLDEFHKNHIWTYTDRTMKKKWVFIKKAKV